MDIRWILDMYIYMDIYIYIYIYILMVEESMDIRGLFDRVRVRE